VKGDRVDSIELLLRAHSRRVLDYEEKADRQYEVIIMTGNNLRWRTEYGNLGLY
jgi:hypothetical protein